MVDSVGKRRHLFGCHHVMLMGGWDRDGGLGIMGLGGVRLTYYCLYIRMACEVCWTYRCDMQFLFPCDAMQIFKHSLMERGVSSSSPLRKGKECESCLRW